MSASTNAKVNWSRIQCYERSGEGEHEVKKSKRGQEPFSWVIPGHKGVNRPTVAITPPPRRCRRWTTSESADLVAAVVKHGKRWRRVAEEMAQSGFTADQCIQHWTRVLAPSISKKPWSSAEDAQLILSVLRHGESAWSHVSRNLPGRTDVMCRYRYLKLLRDWSAAPAKSRRLPPPQYVTPMGASFCPAPDLAPERYQRLMQMYVICAGDAHGMSAADTDCALTLVGLADGLACDGSDGDQDVMDADNESVELDTLDADTDWTRDGTPPPKRRRLSRSATRRAGTSTPPPPERYVLPVTPPGP
eukprot:NODE_1045_length_1496_cov_74.972973_g1034_i0.p1 GENE.NODE_1045_length_1496_cov_74.972973_g1034_i0~~NODE_1045_length_1496_cov_74.972973_g1034_i0.p1  ORF type:complete len:304 (-),score=16.88 NODE_1045_length_1496_cov_74.972973_g1034_i0:502-1413(-)